MLARLQMVNALTVDVEAWHHAEIVRRHVPDSERFSQVPEALAGLRRLFQRKRVRATFFVVGEVVRQHPDLIRELHDEGHEIGCHTMSHRRLGELGEEAFRAELAAFAALTGDILGPGFSPAGFRAPTFSLDQSTSWAIHALADAGYRYDSSVFPLRNPLYGVADCPPAPYRIAPADVSRAAPANGLLWEFPLPVLRLGPAKLPLAGGFYLRLLPLPVIVRGLRCLNDAGIPFTIYVHPWETHPGTPRVKTLSPTDRFITYHNVDGALTKLSALLDRFRFAPMHEALDAARVDEKGGS